MSVDIKTKSYQIYWRIALLFIFLYQPSILQILQLQAFPISIKKMEVLAWLHIYYNGLFNRMRLVIIGLAINLTFIGLIGLQGNLFYLSIARLGHLRGYWNLLLFS